MRAQAFEANGKAGTKKLILFRDVVSIAASWQKKISHKQFQVAAAACQGQRMAAEAFIRGDGRNCAVHIRKSGL